MVQELLWLVESALRHSPSLHAALHQHMKIATARTVASAGSWDYESASGCGAIIATGSTVSTRGGVGGGVARLFSWHSARLAVLLLLLLRSVQPPTLVEMFEAHIGAIAASIAVATANGASASPPTVHVASAWSKQRVDATSLRRHGWACLQRLLRTLVSMPALATRTEVRLAALYPAAAPNCRLLVHAGRCLSLWMRPLSSP